MISSAALVQLVETQTQLAAAQKELELVRTENDAEILRLDGEVKQLEKQLLVVSNADINLLKEPENRLLQHCLSRKTTKISQDHLIGAVVHFPAS